MQELQKTIDAETSRREEVAARAATLEVTVGELTELVRNREQALDQKQAEVTKQPVVELSPQACEHLSTFLKSWHPNERRLLFTPRNGTPCDQNLLLKRRFKPLLRALGINVPRGDGFYILRHGNATLMSSFGAPQKLRQERLGHADGSPVAGSVYTHVISEDGMRVAAQLGNAVWGALDASWT